MNTVLPRSEQGTNSEPPSLSLPRCRMIRASRDFERLKRDGQRLVRGCLIVNWSAAPGQAWSRVGLIASRRVGPAIVRNRARRLLRETFRLHQLEFVQPVDLILIARGSIAGKSRADVDRDFIRALRGGHLLKPGA